MTGSDNAPPRGTSPAGEAGTVDLFIIGGGVNGCGIARDAAGRGLKVALAERGDLAQATSSASTKLFHGGLRYLEFFEFRLVRESLIERERLWQAMPHISWPMRFVLPYHREMRFESSTPTSRLLTTFMPWMKGRRPAWLIRFGLWLYDHLGGGSSLPGTRSLDLGRDPAGAALDGRFRQAFEYSDVWVQDARLVMLNARDAQARGAEILTHCEVTEARRDGDAWAITLVQDGASRQIRARALVNAGGPWVAENLRGTMGLNSTESVRLVRGSHIVTRRLYDHDRCYFFQGRDGRIIFAIPYESDYTLIGTTDQDHKGPPGTAECTPEERDYLCRFASEYFAKPVTPEDVVWTYSGVRPLYDDGASSATAATRDYVLSLDTGGEGTGAPVALHVFGGKITTYRRLAEHALEKLAPHLPMSGEWTAGVALPGGGFPAKETAAQVARLQRDYGFLKPCEALRLFRTYGLEAWDVLGEARCADDLGQRFGPRLTAAELLWMQKREFVRDAADALWRRTKLGLGLSEAEVAAVEAFLQENRHRTAVTGQAPEKQARNQAPSR